MSMRLCNGGLSMQCACGRYVKWWRTVKSDPAGFIPADTHLFQVFFECRSYFAVSSTSPLSSAAVFWHPVHFWLMQIWSTWFSIWWSGDIRVALWILLCGNTLPPIINMLNECDDVDNTCEIRHQWEGYHYMCFEVYVVIHHHSSYMVI